MHQIEDSESDHTNNVCLYERESLCVYVDVMISEADILYTGSCTINFEHRHFTMDFLGS